MSERHTETLVKNELALNLEKLPKDIESNVEEEEHDQFDDKSMTASVPDVIDDLKRYLNKRASK